MPPLPTDLRKTLENAIIAARRAAEEAARAALTTLAVTRSEPFATLDEAQRGLRRGLRAKARQLGDDTKSDAFPLLTHEVAYQQWHRMLFARFLAENGLLMHPSGVAVSLADCAELAPAEGAADAWDLAARYAAVMLPGIFPADDPTVQVRFAPEGRQKLEAILAGLPPAVFTADDGLGWVYQFWQTDKKREVNASGRKIGGADLAPVTQLFTEDYMVRFLLENSLGAWWAARHPDSTLVREWKYLRWREMENAERGTLNAESADPSFSVQHSAFPVPAAGTFPGWPGRAAAITCMDPCGGSGHFVVAEFEMLRRMRMEEEGLSEAEAGDAVIRDNLFMLELDPRCTQIATFALVLAAWRSGGYRPLPTPNITCSGIAVTGQLEDWLRLAGKDERLRTALERLHKLFTNAPTLGSLINPADVPLNERMFTADYEDVAPLLERALARERDDPAAAVLGAAAEGVAKAAKLLAGQYTLVATNVPYLGSGDHTDVLKSYCEQHHPDAAADLATVFLDRCRSYTAPGGADATVTPQNWLFLISYEQFRRRMLSEQSWNFLGWIGEKGFESNAAAGAFTVLVIASALHPEIGHCFAGIDASEPRIPDQKARILQSAAPMVVTQHDQLHRAGARVSFQKLESGSLLRSYASSFQGIKSGDDARMRRYFWEVENKSPRWRLYQSTVTETMPYGGLESVIDWACQGKDLARLQGLGAWGKPGVAVSLMRELRCALYLGGPFDSNMSALVVLDPDKLLAVWAYCRSGALSRAVRASFRKTNASETSLVEVPFDLEYWQSIAESAGPLPEPYSNDPTQWLFAGHPVGASEPLQVAVARLLGYRWPQQADDALGDYADADGIVCLPAVAGEAPAAERLRSLLAAAYGDAWSAAEQERLLSSVGFTGRTLEDWLTDGFFSQHCRLFHNRPFIWHVWDGRKDGFSALVNYHKLDRARLEKLTYTYLGAWIGRQRSELDAGVPAAEGRLVAALALQKKLVAILEGEPPYDIYVRWKPLDKQPIGWAPDLNDGVRLNIRPFVTAGVLRSRFTINWKVDRGTNPDGSERINDRHFTRVEKAAAKTN